ncbi:MAG: alpha-hydroxy acid oxidase, partial [Pseudomonadota bacterium]
YTLSTMSINSIEEVAEATTKPFWFQLYTMKDTDFTSRLIQRAKDAGCSALVITLDLQILGQRHKDLKNGLSAPPKLTPKTIANLATKWSWGLEMLGAKRREFGNIVGHVEGVTDTSQLGRWTAEQFDPSLDWGKVEKLMEQWGGKVILKGILDAEDAKMAAKLGAMALTSLVPWLTAGGNYTPAFVIGAGLAVTAMASIWILCPNIAPLNPKTR